ncbi:MAG: zf-TFIIB domain-containing protein [Planctomycetota bacterium]
MNCPRCTDVEMNEEQIAGVSLDRCPTCHGLWFDMLELEKLLDANPRPLLKEDARFQKLAKDEPRQLHCPRCRGTYLIKLNSRARPGTIVDSCTVCYGTWLDAGELTRLAHADLAGRLRALFGL